MNTENQNRGVGCILPMSKKYAGKGYQHFECTPTFARPWQAREGASQSDLFDLWIIFSLFSFGTNRALNMFAHSLNFLY